MTSAVGDNKRRLEFDQCNDLRLIRPGIDSARIGLESGNGLRRALPEVIQAHLSPISEPRESSQPLLGN